MVALNKKKRASKKEKDDLPRSMRPIIPEPKHRVAPKGVSSGISFRHLPSPSLQTIKKICEHYESKCSGQYNSLASRYVLQMGEEIRSQIEAMVQSSSSLSSSRYDARHQQQQQQQQQHGSSSNKPQHFTFDDSILDDLDFIPTIPNHRNEKEEERQRQYRQYFHHPGTQKPSNPNPSSLRQCQNTTTNERQTTSLSLLQSQIKKLEDQLSETKAELKLQQEKSIKELKDCEQQYRDKNQVDRLHFENSQRLMKHAHDDEMKKLKRDMAQVKSDARLIIDFVRRKANEAIQEESHKMEHQKRCIGKKMEALESQMQKTFHDHLHNLEEEVKMVMRKEKKAINLTVLPPPPPKNIAIMPNNRKSKFGFKKDEIRSFPSDEIETPDLSANDSISTCFSDSGGDVLSNEKSGCISNEHELLKSRVRELEQWTDTLTLALRSGAKITSNKGKPGNSSRKTSLR